MRPGVVRWDVRGRLLVLAVTACGLLAAAPAAQAATPSTARVSVSSTGAEANATSTEPAVSADGRFVAFTSEATNLDPADTNMVPDIFLRDRRTGQTKRINVSAAGAQGDLLSFDPQISDDGRYVVFQSLASTLVAGTTASQTRIYRYDRVAQSLALLPLPASTTGAYDPSMSADGSRVAFQASGDTRGDVYWWDAANNQVSRASETAAGVVANGTSNFDANISGDGRFVGFTTSATNLVTPDTNGYRDVVVKNLATGALDRISGAANGAEANLHSSTPALDFDGCIAGFFSSATNLVAGDTGSQPKVFAADRCGGGGTEIVSLRNAGTQGISGTPIDISANGCRVVFPAASLTTPGATFGSAAVLRDRCVGATSRLDLATSGDPGNGNVGNIDISGGTGRYAAFSTSSPGLVSNDANGVDDIFVRDLAVNTKPVAKVAVSVAGRDATVDATGSRDPDGYILTGSINYGDGTAPQAGLNGTHTYAQAGTYGVTVTVTDADGVTDTAFSAVVIADPGAGPAPPGGLPDGTVAQPGDGGSQLILDRVSVAKSRFAPVRKGRKPDASHGTTLTLRLSGAATVTLKFERARKGRKVKGRCKAGAKKGTSCTLYSADGTLTRALPAGTSRVALTGVLGSRTLAAGAHRLTVFATDAAGRKTAAKVLTITIAKARKK